MRNFRNFFVVPIGTLGGVPGNVGWGFLVWRSFRFPHKVLDHFWRDRFGTVRPFNRPTVFNQMAMVKYDYFTAQ